MKIITCAVVLFAASNSALAQDEAELLRQAHQLMQEAEQLLNDLGSGKAVETQKAVIETLNAILRKARRDAKPPERAQAPPQPKAGEFAGREAVSKFAPKGWGLMSPNEKSAVLDSSRNEIPPEFIEAWNEYYKTLVEEGRRREY